MATAARVALCAALLLGAAVAQMTASEVQVFNFSSKPSGGSLGMYFKGEDATPLWVDVTAPVYAAVLARAAVAALTTYFNGSMTVSATSVEEPFSLTFTFSRGVPQLMAGWRRLMPADIMVTSSTTMDGESVPSCDAVAASILRCHYSSMPDTRPNDPMGYVSNFDTPHRAACCRNASMLLPACGGTPELLFGQWERITNGFNGSVSSLLMSYVGACPRARADLTRPAVPQEVCEARLQGALSCANEVLNRQYFAPVTPREVLTAVSQSCCSNVTGVEYACLGRDIDNRTSPSPMAYMWTLPASQRFFLSARSTFMGGPTYNSSVTSGSDTNAVNVLRQFLLTSYIAMDANIGMFTIAVQVDMRGNAQYSVEFPPYWGSYRPNIEIPMVVVPGMEGSMPIMMREAGYSRDAAILRFLLDGRPDALANFLTNGTAQSMYNITETSLPQLVCPAYTPNFCGAALQVTYSCLTATIRDQRGAVTPVCVRLADMVDTLCQGYPWRDMLSTGNVTLTPAPAAPMTWADVYRGIYRLSDVNHMENGRCDWSIEGMKISAHGRVYSDRCPAANGAQCVSTTPVVFQFGVPYYEVAPMPGYAALSPECGVN